MGQGGQVTQLAIRQAPDTAVRQVQLVQAGQLGQAARLNGQTTITAAASSRLKTACFGVV